MSDVSDYKARVSAEGVDEALSQLRAFAQQVTSIIQAQQQTIQNSLSAPLAGATNQVKALNTTVSTQLKQQGGGSLTQAANSAATFTTQMTHAHHAARAHIQHGVTQHFKEAALAVRDFTSGLTGIGLAWGALELGKKAREIVDSFADWEEGMLRVKLTTGATEAQLKMLGATMHKLAEETGESGAAMREAIVELSTRSGASIEEINVLLPKIVENARNANVDLGTSLRLTTQTMVAFNIPASEMGEVMDHWTATLGPLETQFGRFMERLGPQMRIWGMDTKHASYELAVLFKIGAQIFGGGQRGGAMASEVMQDIIQEALNTLSPTGREVAPDVERVGRGNLSRILFEVVFPLWKRIGIFKQGKLGDLARQQYHIPTRTADMALTFMEHREQAEKLLADEQAQIGANARASAEHLQTTRAEINKRTEQARSIVRKGALAIPGAGRVLKDQPFEPIPSGGGPRVRVGGPGTHLGSARMRRRPEEKQYGGVARGGGSGFSPLPSSASDVLANAQTARANTSATADNTSAVTQLTRVIGPVVERAQASRTSISGALASGFGEPGGGFGGAGTGLAGTPSGEARRAPGGGVRGPYDTGPSVPTAPAALRVPTKPEEGPESIAEAVKGGFMRAPSGGSGPIDRSKYTAELAANPALRAKIMRIAYNEQGANPAGVQGIIESMMNRAAARGTTLEKQARWHESEGGYYQQGNMGRGALENPKTRAVLETAMSNALGGSNTVDYATDNSSAGLAARERASGTFKFTKEINKESFFTPGSAEPGLIPGFETWRAAQQAAAATRNAAGAAPKPPSFTTADIAALRGEPAAAVAAGSDLEYLAAHGGHSTVAGKNVPLGTIPVDREFAARLAAAGRAYTAETGRQPTFREISRDYATQAEYYRHYQAGGGLAARPGTSRHEVTEKHAGQASDLPSGPFRDWLEGNRSKFGIEGIRGDRPHQQLSTSYRGPAFYHPEQQRAAAAPTAATATEDRGTMLFAQGIEARYGPLSGGTVTPAMVEQQARETAEALGYKGFVNISGAGTPEQERAAITEALKSGKITGVTGFSRGANILRQMLLDPKTSPEIKSRIKDVLLVGGSEHKDATVVPGARVFEAEKFKDTPHMQMMAKVRDAAKKTAEQHKEAAVKAAAEKPKAEEPQVSDASRMAEGGVVKANQGGVVPLPHERPQEAPREIDPERVMHPPEGYDLSRIHGRVAPLSELGFAKTGYAYPGGSEIAPLDEGTYGTTGWNTGTGAPTIAYEGGRRAAAEKETLIHEGGHAGLKSLIGTEDLRQLEKGYPQALRSGFEELRQRQADIQRVHELGPQAMHSRTYRQRLTAGREMSAEIAARIPGEGDIAAITRSYNAEVNELAARRLSIAREQANAYNKHALDLMTVQSGADNWVVQ